MVRRRNVEVREARVLVQAVMFVASELKEALLHESRSESALHMRHTSVTRALHESRRESALYERYTNHKGSQRYKGITSVTRALNESHRESALHEHYTSVARALNESRRE